MLPCASAVCCSWGASSTRTSVMTTSAPMLASVSASWRPRPREAPVTTATRPERSNIPQPLNLMVAPPHRRRAWSQASCVRRDRLGHDRLSLLVLCAQLEPPFSNLLSRERDLVAGEHHAGKAARQAAQVRRSPCGLRSDDREQT